MPLIITVNRRVC